MILLPLFWVSSVAAQGAEVVIASIHVGARPSKILFEALGIVDIDISFAQLILR